MEYISSDTNVWYDYYSISKLHLPFKLKCVYLMFYEALREEIIDPPELISSLKEYGLVEVSIQTEEFYIAAELSRQYPKLSGYDSIALSIAKNRKIMLLTGDNALRKAATKEGVRVIGSIGLIDRLFQEKRITETEYIECLKAWKNDNLTGRRLPVEELEKRINLYTRKEGKKR